jgi:hypothetical protein
VRSLAFSFDAIPQPYRFMLHYLRTLECPPAVNQLAWRACNDSYFTTVCCRYPPHTIACAAMYIFLFPCCLVRNADTCLRYLAARMLSFELPGPPHVSFHWYEAFDARLADMLGTILLFRCSLTESFLS